VDRRCRACGEVWESGGAQSMRRCWWRGSQEGLELRGRPGIGRGSTGGWSPTTMGRGDDAVSLVVIATVVRHARTARGRAVAS
jgi:hypothetical protein